MKLELKQLTIFLLQKRNILFWTHGNLNLKLNLNYETTPMTLINIIETNHRWQVPPFRMLPQSKYRQIIKFVVYFYSFKKIVPPTEHKMNIQRNAGFVLPKHAHNVIWTLVQRRSETMLCAYKGSRLIQKGYWSKQNNHEQPKRNINKFKKKIHVLGKNVFFFILLLE